MPRYAVLYINARPESFLLQVIHIRKRLTSMDVISWVVGLVLCFLPLLIWALSSFNQWRYCRPYLASNKGGKLPPGHMGWPIIGELMDFLWCFKFTSKPDDFIWKRRAKYGDTGIYRTHLFGSPSVITCSPEFNRFVMGTGTEDGSFLAGWPAPRLFGEKFISMVEGEHHKRLRRVLQEAINKPQSLQNIFTRLQPAFKEAFQNWAAKGTINTAEEIRTLAFSNICSLLLSYERSPMLETMETMYRGLLAGLRAHPANIPGTAYHYALQCRKSLSGIVCCEMHERKAHKGSVKTDYLQDLMDSVDSNGTKLSEEEVNDNITSLLLGGYESTASSMMWALYYLSKYPKVLAKLKEEHHNIRKEKGEDNILNYKDAKKMTYTSKVIDEVIRLANVANFMFREVAKDTEFNGYKFPKGWKVIIWLRSIHVDPHYFEDPLQFNPERWEGFNPKPGVYNVFGYGPRLCPGNNLAKMQLVILLYSICMNFEWELLNPNEDIKFLPNPRPADGAKLKFREI